MENDVPRNEMYAEAATFGLNTDKCRWIASFLLNTGLIEESRYGSLRATPRGIALTAELPLAGAPETPRQPTVTPVAETAEQPPRTTQDLARFSRHPQAKGELPGRAFEYAVRDAFLAMGFEARLISGSNDTDIVVTWREADGTPTTAIVEAKARTSGIVSHTDVSDVGLETHKGRHHARFVAVVGPSFSGDTIKDMAARKHWALIDADRLGTLVEDVIALGLRPHEAAQLFHVPNGLSDLDDLIANRRRRLDIVSFVITKLAEEEEDERGEPISARDIFRGGRSTELRPSVEEILDAIEDMSGPHADALRLVDASGEPKYATYTLGDALAGARRLRALADAIERRIDTAA